MKSKLVVGLGNRLVPEDTAGLRCFDHLERAAVDRDDIEFMHGGTDLLRLADHLRGRELILLVDAASGADRAISLVEHGSPDLDDAQVHAHHLSAVQALALLRWSDEEIRKARCYWVLIDEGA